MITTYPRAVTEHWAVFNSRIRSMVDVPRFELANLCAQEQRLILKGFLIGLKAAYRLK
jgi:hypothetical protein